MSKNKRKPTEKAEIAEEAADADVAIGDLVFEDPFGDDFEDEDFVDEDGDDEDDEEGDDAMEDGMDEDERAAIDNGDDDEEAEASREPNLVWRAGVDKLPEGEELEYDPSAYVMYHTLRTEWPCLSFDVMKDSLGDSRSRFPMTMFMICGSQAERPDKNCLTLLKLSDLNKTQEGGEDDEDEDEDDNVDEDPTLEHVNIPHHGGVNRIRSMPQSSGIVATMADTGSVHIYDLTQPFRGMQQRGPATAPSLTIRPEFSFKGNREEGFALDWSCVSVGQLAVGDCTGAIRIIRNATAGASSGSGSWKADSFAYTGHTGSVEDLQWSPSEATVFASASADRTVKIWDTRGRAGPQLSINAHVEDVNVISWNRNVGYLLASGSDDGSFKVWDLRMLGKPAPEPLAHFTYHSDAVTSLEWAPHDESLICVSSADDQVSVWDLSVEAEPETAGSSAALPEDFPPQLLFIHQGQKNVKEIHFHPQIPGLIVSTAEDGFNVFKPAINVG